MPNPVLSARLGTERDFRAGEELILALGLATADLTAEITGILKEHGLGHTQYNVLRILRGVGERGATHGDLTKWMIVGVPDITRMIDRMKSAGWVQRERDAEDRRRVLHRITPTGARLLEKVEPQIAAIHTWIERALAEDERETLVSLCARVIELAATKTIRETESC